MWKSSVCRAFKMEGSSPPVDRHPPVAAYRQVSWVRVTAVSMFHTRMQMQCACSESWVAGRAWVGGHVSGGENGESFNAKATADLQALQAVPATCCGSLAYLGDVGLIGSSSQ